MHLYEVPPLSCIMFLHLVTPHIHSQQTCMPSTRTPLFLRRIKLPPLPTRHQKDGMFPVSKIKLLCPLYSPTFTISPTFNIMHLPLSPIHFKKKKTPFHLFLLFSGHCSITHRWHYITGWVSHCLLLLSRHTLMKPPSPSMPLKVTSMHRLPPNHHAVTTPPP